MEYLDGKTSCGVIHDGLGDWCDVGPNPPFAQNTPVSLTATAVYYYDLLIMEMVSGCLEDRGRQEYYREKRGEIRQAFNREFYEAMGQRYSTGSQTANSLALFLDLPLMRNRGDVLNFLLRDLEIRGYHMTGGDVGFPFLLRTLMKFGYHDVIARMMENTDIPSYGYQILNGATTLCEEWDGNRPGYEKNSQNHFMLGSIEEWFYGGLGGIHMFSLRDTDGRICICPAFVRQVNRVDAECEIPQGKVASRWNRNPEGTVCLEVRIPVNAEAVIILPILENREIPAAWQCQQGIRKTVQTERDCRIYTGSGTYYFEVKEQAEG